MYLFLWPLLFFLPFLCAISVDQYVDVVSIYYRFRAVKVLTHFTCFETHENMKIHMQLSSRGFQSRFILKFMNISGIIDTPKTTSQGFIVNEECDRNDFIFLQADSKELFKDNNIWLFINLVKQSNDIPINRKAFLANLKLWPISDVKYAINQTNGTEAQWKLFDIYKIGEDFSLEIFVFGFIVADDFTELIPKTVSTEEHRFRMTELFLSKSIRNDLKGLKLTCGLVIAFPERYTYLEDPAVENIDLITKATANIALNMRENLNMSCAIIQVDNYGWNINGTFNGAMGLFQQKRIQALSHGTIMREDRLKYVEFTGEIFVFETPIIFRQPPLSSIANIFLLPLDWAVWQCCIVAFFVIIGAMCVQMLSHPIARRQLYGVDVFTFVWGAVCQQGTHLKIASTSGRFIALTTFLATLAIFTSYSASIVALLQSPSHSIKTIDNLLHSPLKMALQETGYNRYYYLVENIPILNKVYDAKIRPMGENGWIYNPFDGIEKIRTEMFAFQVESSSAYRAVAHTYTENEKCSLSEIHLLRLAVTTVTVERNSPYKELFKRRIRWQRENGLMNRSKRRWFPRKPLCEGGARGFKTVGIDEIKPAVFMLLFGFAAALGLMLAEIAFANRQNIIRYRKREFKRQKLLKNPIKKI